MPFVLTTSSTVLCGAAGPPDVPDPLHGGKVKLVGVSKLKAGGSPVLLKAGIGPDVTGCKTPGPPASTSPCATVTISSGEAGKLTVDGAGVMLESSSLGSSSGNPAGKVPASAGQTKLSAT